MRKKTILLFLIKAKISKQIISSPFLNKQQGIIKEVTKKL